MSIRVLKLLNDAGWILIFLPAALTTFGFTYYPWLSFTLILGCGMSITAFIITRKIPEARLHDELIQNETFEYYKKYPWRPTAIALLVLFVLSLPYIEKYARLTHNQIIYVALFIWYAPHVIGNALFGGRRALRKSPLRVGGE